MNTGRVDAEDEDISLLGFAAGLIRQRRVIYRFVVAGLLVAVIAVLLRPRTYSSSFSFLAQGKSLPQGNLASLAGQFGLNLAGLGGSQNENPQLYADLLTTSDILTPIAGDSIAVDSSGARVPLAQFLDIDDANEGVRLQKTVRYLRTRVIAPSVAARTTGMVTVRVRTGSAVASREIAQRLLDGLNNFNLVTRQSQARQERVFAEARLKEAQASLRSAEDRLQKFLESNREITAPLLVFARDRLQRDVTFQQQIVTSLGQQYEENRINEVRDTPVITVMERPRVPVLPDPGLRALILGLGVMGGMLVGVLAVMLREMWQRSARAGSPGLASFAAEVRGMFKASK